MTETTLINAQTAAVTVTLDARAYETVVFQAEGLGAAETIAVNRGGGATWVTLRHLDPVTPTNNAVGFTGSGGTPASVAHFETVGGYYQVVKGVTGGAVTVTATLGAKKHG